jgi:hypothetical protein
MVPADGKTLVMWTAAQQANSQLNHYRQHCAFSSPITCLHWHPNQPGHVAFGHQDGTLSFYTAGIRHTRTRAKHYVRVFPPCGSWRGRQKMY